MTPRRFARSITPVWFLFAALALALGTGGLHPRLAGAADPVKWDPARTTAPEDPAELKALQDAVTGVVQKCTPATVGIKLINEFRSRGGRLQMATAQGSGVIVSADGLVLTAAHVISPEPPEPYKPGREVTLVLSDGSEVKGKTLGVNRKMDSGMLRITDKGPNGGKWPFVPVGKSGDLKRGQWLVTLGHPGGYKEGRPPVARLGRFQGIERYIRGVEMNLLRTDTTIVGGDSGGPLFDLNARVVGIHSQIGPELTLNLHVATDTFKADWDAMLDGAVLPKAPPQPPVIGVVFDEKKNASGVRVESVVEDGPAATAGFKDGDVITTFGGKKVATANDIRELLAKHKPGDVVEVAVLRDDDTVTLKVKLGKR